MEDLNESSIDSLCGSDDFMDSAEVMGHTYLPSGMVVVSEGVQIREARASEKTEPGTRYVNDARFGGTVRRDSVDIETDGETSTRFDERVNEILYEKSDASFDEFNQSDDLKENIMIGVQEELDEVVVTGHMTLDRNSHVAFDKQSSYTLNEILESSDNNKEMTESGLDDNVSNTCSLKSKELDLLEQIKTVEEENSENTKENNSENSIINKTAVDDALKKLYVNRDIVQSQTESCDIVDNEENVYNNSNMDLNIAESDNVTENLFESNQSVVSQLSESSVLSNSGVDVQAATVGDIVGGQGNAAISSTEQATNTEAKVDAHKADTVSDAVGGMIQTDLFGTEQDMNSEYGSAETSQSEFNVTNSSDISSDPMSNTSGNVIPDGAGTEALFDMTVDNGTVPTENSSEPQQYDASVNDAGFLVKVTQNTKLREEKTMPRFSKTNNCKFLNFIFLQNFLI